MTKIKVLLLGLGLSVILASYGHAALAARGAKKATTITGTTAATSVVNGPAVLYAVMLSSTSNQTEFLMVRDSSFAVTTGALAVPPIAPMTSTSVSGLTNLVFDPPIQFRSGISANLVVGLSTATVVYESGRVTSGY